MLRQAGLDPLVLASEVDEDALFNSLDADTMRFDAGPTLLVIDELGYLPLPAEAASALFQVISQRYLNLDRDHHQTVAWGPGAEILGDTTVAAAMLDGLPHRSVVINLERESYRLRDHQAATETLREPPPAPANNYIDPCSQVRNFGEHSRGLPMSTVNGGRWRDPPGAC